MAEEYTPSTAGEGSEYNIMLAWIQKRIILTGFDQTFDPTSDELAITFLSDPQTRRMVAMLKDGKLLMATNDFSSLPLAEAKVMQRHHGPL